MRKPLEDRKWSDGRTSRAHAPPQEVTTRTFSKTSPTEESSQVWGGDVGWGTHVKAALQCSRAVAKRNIAVRDMSGDARSTAVEQNVKGGHKVQTRG